MCACVRACVSECVRECVRIILSLPVGAIGLSMSCDYGIF